MTETACSFRRAPDAELVRAPLTPRELQVLVRHQDFLRVAGQCPASCFQSVGFHAVPCGWETPRQARVG